MSSTEALEERLVTGRNAVARRAWPDAYEALHSADTGSELGPDDLELLAKTAWWVGRPAESIAARERAYAKFLERGDKQGAAFTALTLRRQYRMKNAGSVAQGWLNRAERLLEGEPESDLAGLSRARARPARMVRGRARRRAARTSNGAPRSPTGSGARIFAPGRPCTAAWCW